jgi:small subunit ribosomal protein S1
MDFGAFVELGNGVDGLIHVSQLGWGRVRHPSEVLQEGQRIKVRIDKFDPDTGKIGLGYRELVEENPWTQAEARYLPNTAYHGKVVKVMDFGAFVELEPGLEGLIHISELAHRRVARVSEVVKEGEEVDVMVLSVDPGARRISLSMKSLLAPPQPEPKVEGKPESASQEPPPPPPKPKKQGPTRPLQGGLGKTPGGSQFGLKW